jgi:excisionase family DNA binding protein
MTKINLTQTLNDIQINTDATTNPKVSAFLSLEADKLYIELVNGTDKPKVMEISIVVLRLLGEILNELALGNNVKVIPINAELTTQKAADLLNVSRPYLVKLLEEGVLPFTKIGKHRRVKLADLMAYKKEREESSQSAMNELAAQSQELGMGFTKRESAD